MFGSPRPFQDRRASIVMGDRLRPRSPNPQPGLDSSAVAIFTGLVVLANAVGLYFIWGRWQTAVSPPRSPLDSSPPRSNSDSGNGQGFHRGVFHGQRHRSEQSTQRAVRKPGSPKQKSRRSVRWPTGKIRHPHRSLRPHPTSERTGRRASLQIFRRSSLQSRINQANSLQLRGPDRPSGSMERPYEYVRRTRSEGVPHLIDAASLVAPVALPTLDRGRACAATARRPTPSLGGQPDSVTLAAVQRLARWRAKRQLQRSLRPTSRPDCVWATSGRKMIERQAVEATPIGPARVAVTPDLPKHAFLTAI